MYVRKFEADTLEEALKEIKHELGPDAIILKTITNKGLKGAFKKKKIEITAAISEKNYSKKANVDKVLDDQQKQSFYSNQSSYVSNMIDNYTPNKEAAPSAAGYGQLGLNRAVHTSNPKPAAPEAAPGLDDFLRAASTPTPTPKQMVSERAKPAEKVQAPTYDFSQEMEAYQNKIEELERQLFNMAKNIERLDRREPEGIFQLRNTLKTLDISELYIQRLIKSASFELSREELENPDIVFEFSLKEMLEEVPIGMPLFSSEDTGENSVITVLVSETSCGQTSMLQKLGALKSDCVLIKDAVVDDEKRSFVDKMFNLDIIYVNGIGEIVSECRKAVEAGKSVFIDYRSAQSESNDTKKFVDGLRRAFARVEVLITLSAIHTELYNRKMISRYGQLSDGVVVSHLDQCMNFGSLFNLGLDDKRLPFKFFGTGETVPDDLEAATAERILAGVFQLD